MAGRILMVGPPGAGKGTQAMRLVDSHGWAHISTGDIFRSHLDKGTPFGERIQEYVSAGRLVPDDLTCQVVVRRLSEDDCSLGYILDGFPRSVSQAEALDEMLEERDEALDMVLVMELPDESLVERLTARRSCQICGEIYNLKFNPPFEEGVCDSPVCGGAKLLQREDDKEETVRERLRVYHESTEPLIQHYATKGLVKKVEGGSTPDEIEQHIELILNEGGVI